MSNRHFLGNTAAIGLILGALCTGAHAQTSANLTGTWQILSNNTPGTLVLQHTINTYRCKHLTGTFRAGDTGPVVGVYCPYARRIYLARHKDDDPVPFQMYEGHVSNDGKTISGSFFYWGNESITNNSAPDAPYFATR